MTEKLKSMLAARAAAQAALDVVAERMDDCEQDELVALVALAIDRELRRLLD